MIKYLQWTGFADSICLGWGEVVFDKGGFVPEKDRFERSLGAGWCAVYQHVKNRSTTPKEINDKIVKTLTKNLRDRRGVPGFQAMMSVISAPLGFPFSESVDAIDQIVGGGSGHRHTKVAAKEAKSLLVRRLASEVTLEPQNLSHRFATKVCYALVEHYFFARALPKLIAEGRFVDRNEAFEWQGRIERNIQDSIGKIAVKLLQQTDGKGLRAPRRTALKMSTSDLLAEQLI